MHNVLFVYATAANPVSSSAAASEKSRRRLAKETQPKNTAVTAKRLPRSNFSCCYALFFCRVARLPPQFWSTCGLGQCSSSSQPRGRNAQQWTTGAVETGDRGLLHFFLKLSRFFNSSTRWTLLLFLLKKKKIISQIILLLVSINVDRSP